LVAHKLLICLKARYKYLYDNTHFRMHIGARWALITTPVEVGNSGNGKWKQKMEMVKS